MDKKEVVKWLNFYKKNNWVLIPIAKNTKVPIEGFKWRGYQERDIKQWISWLKEGHSLAVLTGPVSNLIIFDIDAMPSKLKKAWYEEKISDEDKKLASKQKEDNLKIIQETLMPFNINTLTQTTFGGIQLYFKYNETIPKTNLKLNKVHVDIEADGGYVVIYPSIVGKKSRSFKNPVIEEMPDELKNIIINRKKGSQKITSVEISTDFHTDLDLTKDIEGEELLQYQRNNFLIKYGGVLRKRLTMNDTKYTIINLNKMLRGSDHNPQEIDALLRSLEQYQFSEEQELGKVILEYLKIAEEATERDLREVKGLRGEEKEKIAIALRYLLDNNFIFRRRNLYNIVKHPEWKTEFEEEGKILNFKVPYFHDCGIFREGDIILIGAKTGAGKTHIAGNMVKQLAAQKVKPCYISLESGSRFPVISRALKLKVGSFEWAKVKNPESIELKEDRVTIIDWLRPKDFAKVDEIFEDFSEMMDRKRGLLIIFMQLKKDNSWFSPNLVDQYPALAVKFLHEDPFDRTYSYFEIEKNRESRTKKQQSKIPCKYHYETKELLVVNQEEDLNAPDELSEMPEM